MYKQRRGIISVQNFLIVLYYIFNIENVVVEESQSERLEKILKQSKNFFWYYDARKEILKKQPELLKIY